MYIISYLKLFFIVKNPSQYNSNNYQLKTFIFAIVYEQTTTAEITLFFDQICLNKAIEVKIMKVLKVRVLSPIMDDPVQVCAIG